jgi:hypothetical protein
MISIAVVASIDAVNIQLIIKSLIPSFLPSSSAVGLAVEEANGEGTIIIIRTIIIIEEHYDEEH